MYHQSHFGTTAKMLIKIKYFLAADISRDTDVTRLAVPPGTVIFPDCAVMSRNPERLWYKKSVNSGKEIA
jgi:hypothetical protein